MGVAWRGPMNLVPVVIAFGLEGGVGMKEHSHEKARDAPRYTHGAYLDLQEVLGDLVGCKNAS